MTHQRWRPVVVSVGACFAGLELDKEKTRPPGR